MLSGKRIRQRVKKENMRNSFFFFKDRSFIYMVIRRNWQKSGKPEKNENFHLKVPENAREIAPFFQQ